jgi:hypothetical protein
MTKRVTGRPMVALVLDDGRELHSVVELDDRLLLAHVSLIALRDAASQARRQTDPALRDAQAADAIALWQALRVMLPELDAVAAASAPVATETVQ